MFLAPFTTGHFEPKMYQKIRHFKLSRYLVIFFIRRSNFKNPIKIGPQQNQSIFACREHKMTNIFEQVWLEKMVHYALKEANTHTSQMQEIDNFNSNTFAPEWQT